MRVLVPAGRLAFAWRDAPARNRLQDVLIEPAQEANATPPANLPVGPPILRCLDDGELGALLALARLEQVRVTPHSFTYGIATADVLWDGAMGSLARTSALVMAFKIASGRKA